MPTSKLPSQNASVFISYARADDLIPPFEEKTKGWVTFFWDQLRFELTDRGAKQAELWLDRYQIDPAEAFTSKIETAVAEAKLVVAICSANWVQSEWCQREVETFGRIHTDAIKRLIPVFKNDLERDRLPLLMQGDSAQEGYHFFDSDATGKTHEFYWRGLQDEKAYFDIIKRIALRIIDRLDIVPSASSKPLSQSAAPAGKTIFVALAASDLRDARQRLVNDLSAAGFQVFPTENAVPETSKELEEIVKQALDKAEWAIHLLGESRGITVEGGTDALIDYQLRLTRETSVPRVLWIPRWLPGQTDGKRDPAEAAKGFGGLGKLEEIYGEDVTGLSKWLRERLKPEMEVVDNHSNAKFERILVAAAHRDDEELTVALANQAQGCGLTVQACFPDEEPPAELDHTLVLIPWGAAKGVDLQTLLSRLAQPAQMICLQLPGGDETAKRRFFQENVLLEKMDALPSNRQEAKKLLVSLEIFAANGNGK